MLQSNKSVIVTTSWDDGHKLDLRLSGLLKKYNIAGTFYISPHNREIIPNHLLSDSQVRQLSANFEIGAHTYNHFDLTKIPLDRAEKEIIESKKYLENLLHKEISSFCYPRGQFNPDIKRIVQKAGFRLGRTIKRFETTMGVDPYSLPTTVHVYDHLQDLVNIPLILLNKTISWDSLAIKFFDRVNAQGGIFHLWGHSWEIDKNGDWERLENILKYISNRKNVLYLTNESMVNYLPKRQPKVLFVTPYFPPLVGGTENYVYNLARGLYKKHGWQVIVITTSKNSNIKYQDGLKIYYLPYWFKLSNTPINPLWILEIKKIINKEDPDIINAHSPVPFISDVASLVTGQKPFVLTYHSASMVKNKFFPDMLIKLYERLIFRKTAEKAIRIISASEYVRDHYLQKYQDKIVLVKPGVDIPLIKEEKPDKHNLIFIGKLIKAEKHKGLIYLLYAVAEVKKYIPDVQLTIVGSGNLLKKYQELASRYGIINNVKFVGLLRGDKLYQEIKKAVGLILPSVSDNIPIVCLEAFACKRPVIASNVGNLNNMVDESNGYLVPPKNITALSKAIIRLINNPKKTELLGQNAFKKIKKEYLWDYKLNHTNDLFKLLINWNYD